MKKEILEKVLSSQKNLIVAGDVGTGKTVNTIFPLVDEMIKKDESLLFLDSKEEYINKYYNELKSKNYNIVVLNLRNMENSDGWNPLSYPYSLYKNNETDRALEYIEKTGKTMFHEEGSMDPFWSITSSDFFTGIVLGLFEDAKKEEINLNSVNSMFDAINKKYGASDIISKYFETKGSSSQAYIYASSTFLAPKDTKGSILSVARQKLRTYITREKLNILMSETTFNYEDIISKPTAIFVIGRDENINGFIEMLSSGTSRKIKFVLATRSVENLLNIYTSYIDKLSNIISITNNEITIKVNNETETIENNFEEIELSNETIYYPNMGKKEIKLFNVEEYVIIKYGSQLTEKNSSSESNKTNSSIDINELKNKIDKRIAELEESEKRNLN